MPSREANPYGYLTTFLARTLCPERDNHLKLMMYGAAGRTGGLAAAEVVRSCLRWVAAGRDAWPPGWHRG